MAIANHRPAAHALLFVSCLSLWCTTHVNSRLTNVVTDWIEATQEVVTFVGAHEVTASRWYALLSTAIYNSVVTGQFYRLKFYASKAKQVMPKYWDFAGDRSLPTMCPQIPQPWTWLLNLHNAGLQE